MEPPAQIHALHPSRARSQPFRSRARPRRFRRRPALRRSGLCRLIHGGDRDADHLDLDAVRIELLGGVGQGDLGEREE